MISTSVNYFTNDSFIIHLKILLSIQTMSEDTVFRSSTGSSSYLMKSLMIVGVLGMGIYNVLMVTGD